MAQMWKLLGTIRPTTTKAVMAIQAPRGMNWVIRQRIIVPVGVVQVKVSMFHDPRGRTYDEHTALLWKYQLGPGYMPFNESNDLISLEPETGSIGVQVDVPSAAVFHFYGWEL